jgi:hypothetical protein
LVFQRQNLGEDFQFVGLVEAEHGRVLGCWRVLRTKTHRARHNSSWAILKGELLIT